MPSSSTKRPELSSVARVPGAARILGVDPGLTRCGFGLIDMLPNRKASFVNVGVAGTIAAETLDQRILTIFQVAQEWLDTYQPDALAIERIFAQEQVNTVIGTAHASGVVIAAAASRGIPVYFHTPSEVKAAVTGSGRADKASVGRMVTRILGWMLCPNLQMPPMLSPLRFATAGVEEPPVEQLIPARASRHTRAHDLQHNNGLPL